MTKNNNEWVIPNPSTKEELSNFINQSKNDELINIKLIGEMSEVFNNAIKQGLDPYTEVANQFNIERQVVKTRMLGIIYNISPVKLKDILNTNPVTDSSSHKS